MLYKIDLNYYCPFPPSKSLRKAIIWLNRRKKSFTKKTTSFDYPDYWGMPKSITCRLSGDDVDFIQFHTYNWWNEDTE